MFYNKGFFFFFFLGKGFFITSACSYTSMQGCLGKYLAIVISGFWSFLETGLTP